MIILNIVLIFPAKTPSRFTHISEKEKLKSTKHLSSRVWVEARLPGADKQLELSGEEGCVFGKYLQTNRSNAVPIPNPASDRSVVGNF